MPMHAQHDTVMPNLSVSLVGGQIPRGKGLVGETTTLPDSDWQVDQPTVRGW